MLALLGELVFTDMSTLSPQTLLEFFMLMILMEFIGVIISYTRGA